MIAHTNWWSKSHPFNWGFHPYNYYGCLVAVLSTQPSQGYMILVLELFRLLPSMILFLNLKENLASHLDSTHAILELYWMKYSHTEIIRSIYQTFIFIHLIKNYTEIKGSYRKQTQSLYKQQLYDFPKSRTRLSYRRTLTAQSRPMIRCHMLWGYVHLPSQFIMDRSSPILYSTFINEKFICTESR